jgi:nucleoside-diphosphate-sugar epimerase
MRVFVTGATGFVGSAVVQELIGAGYQVTGLARSDAAAQAVEAAGAQVLRGDLADPGSLRDGTAMSDAVIHCGFIHDFANFKACCETDRAVIATLGDALAGSDRPLIVTSAMGILPQGRLLSETTKPASGSNTHPRVATEEAADAAAARGVNVAVLRLPPSVHGKGDHGFVPILIGIARQQGEAGFGEPGANRWSAVHRQDAARLYRLALEHGAAHGFSGVRYHCVAEEGIAFREIAGVVGRRLDLPVAAKPQAEADAYFGWFARFAAMDVPADSSWTRAQLNWQPTGPGLLADLDSAAYFSAP